MEQLSFINSLGEKVSFKESYSLIKVEGLGDVEVEDQLQKAPYQDGSSLIGITMKERSIFLEFRINGSDYEEISLLRQKLAKILNPKLALGTLQYTTGTIIREIKAYARSVPVYPDNIENRTLKHQIGLLQLIAPNPFWKTITIEEEPTFEALFQFPFEDEFEMGMQRDRRVIDNDGDAPCPIQVEFHGPAVNPIITNTTTGEFIRVNQTLGEEEYMLIDTSDEEKSVVFIDGQNNKRNVFNWIDLSSDFFKLQLGENIIEYSADSDIQGAIVNIRYQKQYNAV